MITCIQTTGRVFHCNNCNRVMPVTLIYYIVGKDCHPTIALCEDCSNALGNLHHEVMVTGATHKYDMDEITEVRDDD